MLLRKEGLPDENELVLCTITDIYYHSVFAKLDEYDKVGMIHISEIAPGRIRNIRDFVKEGKKVICKVLRVNKEKEQVDLSLRRVNESSARTKNNQIKKELLAESIVDTLAKQLKKKTEEIYAVITDKLFEKYTSLYEAFELVSKDEIDLVKEGIEKSLASALTQAIKQRIKPQLVTIKTQVHLQTYVPDGVADIHETMSKAKNVKGDFTITYTGGGSYRVVVVAEEFKTAEAVTNNISKLITEEFTKKGGKAQFARMES